MSRYVEYAWTANDNEIKQTFESPAGTFKDLSAATKIAIEIFTNEDDPIDRNAAVKSFNSIDDADIFDITDLASGNITFKPLAADMTDLTGSTYYARWVVTSADYPNGIVWGHDLFELAVSL